MFDVSISLEEDKILGEFLVDSYFFEPSRYDYVFYLFKDDERIETSRYSKNMKVNFHIKDMTGVFRIKCFIRDIEQGKKRGYFSEKISINN